MKRFFLLILLLGASSVQAKVDSLGHLPYYLKGASSENLLFEQGYSAFAVESVKERKASLSSFYAHQYLFDKKNESNNLTLNTFSIGNDLFDVYDSSFYSMQAAEGLPILLGGAFQIKNTSFSFNELSPEKEKYAPIYAKLLFSGKYEGFYLGAFLLYQSVSYDTPSNASKTFQDTHFYYHLSAGYKLSDSLTFLFLFDNVFNLYNEERDYSISSSELTAVPILPYQTLKIFRSPLYRFNASAKSSRVYEDQIDVGGGVYHQFKESITDSSPLRLKTGISYQSDFLNFIFELNYLKISYQSEMGIKLSSSSLYSNYEKTGSFQSVYYKMTAFFKPSSLFEEYRWYFLVDAEGDFYSKIKENIIGTNTFDIETDYGRNKIGMVIGNRNKAREFWFYGSMTLYKTLVLDYTSDLNDTTPLYNNIYISEEEMTKTRKKSWILFLGGLASRYTWQEWVLDMGIHLGVIKLPASVDQTYLDLTFGASYRLNPESELKLSYLRRTYFSSKLYIQEDNESKGYSFQGTETSFLLSYLYYF